MSVRKGGNEMKTVTFTWLLAGVVGCVGLAGCDGGEDTGASISETGSELHGCRGSANQSRESSYYLSTFSGSGRMSCGGSTRGGSWYYVANRQQFGCGTHLRITANSHCVVAESADYGPDACVDAAAGAHVLDASPLVAKALFGRSSAGWSDRLHVTVEPVERSVSLGACSAASQRDPDPGVSQEPPPDAPLTGKGTKCTVDGVPGECMDVGDCNGTSTPHHCPGPTNIQCCTL
jgi:hypothetical protein